MSPDLIAITVPFLIEIGRFAKDELHERWIAQRKSNEKITADLSHGNKTEIEGLFSDLQHTQKSWSTEIISKRFQLVQKLKLSLIIIHDSYVNGQMLAQHYALQKREMETGLAAELANLKKDLGSLDIDIIVNPL